MSFWQLKGKDVQTAAVLISKAKIWHVFFSVLQLHRKKNETFGILV